MTTGQPSIDDVLVADFIARSPREVITHLERRSPDAIGRFLVDRPAEEAAMLVEHMRSDAAGSALQRLGPERCGPILQALDAGRAAPCLAQFDDDVREACLRVLPTALAEELRGLLAYPPDSAGALMDPKVTTFRPNTTVGQALAQLRALGEKRIHYVFVIDDEHRLIGAIPLQDVAVAVPNEPLNQLIKQPPITVQAMSSVSEVVEVMQPARLAALPVVDVEGRLLGVIRHDALFHAAEAEATVDIQTMVGASREERALSSSFFAVRKRLPWLNINLLTAFLAAAVVALFEGTIARITALAVLMPVVAGQAGNTGAQALAVTMRGLALREIRVRHWWRIVRKEFVAGVINGIAVAVVTGAGVYVWSGSLGLTGVIGIAMVFSMALASLSGASVPMVLTLLRQDPAQSSSIILTTVTDVVGFMSFLGLATIAAQFI